MQRKERWKKQNSNGMWLVCGKMSETEKEQFINIFIASPQPQMNLQLSGVRFSWGENKRIYHSARPSACSQDFYFSDTTFHLLVLICEDVIKHKHLIFLHLFYYISLAANLRGLHSDDGLACLRDDIGGRGGDVAALLSAVVQEWWQDGGLYSEGTVHAVVQHVWPPPTFHSLFPSIAKMPFLQFLILLFSLHVAAAYLDAWVTR